MATRDAVVFGRYYGLHAKIGIGGMASVYLGWLSGAANFSRVVAIKRMHPLFALDEHFAARFRDEARLTARLSHPSIVQVFDVVERNRELLIIMEYVHGVSLGNLARDALAAGLRIPPSVIAGVMVPALHGLHAAHEATDDEGRPIGIVHRDFSPQNIMVSCEGHAKVLDFGVAKAKTHVHVTSAGKFSGKLGYCSPEQVGSGAMDRRTDLFAAGIVLWEMLAGERLFHAAGLTDGAAVARVLTLPVRPPSSINPEVPSRVDEIVLRALQRKPENRFATARELASELEAAIAMATPSSIAEWVDRACGKRMAKLTRILDGARRRMARTRLGLAETRIPLEERALPAESLRDPDLPTPATVNERGQRRAGRPWAKMAVGGAIGLVLLVVALRGTVFRTTHVPSTANNLTPAQTLRRAPQVSPVSVPAPTAPDPTAASNEPVAAPVPAQPKPSGLHASRPQRAGAKHPRQAPTVKKAIQPNCNPPTYLDADGIRIFKDECL